MPPALQAEVESEVSRGSRSLRRPRTGGSGALAGEDLPDGLSVAPEVRGPHTVSGLKAEQNTLHLTVLPPNSTFIDLV